jgi:hypothetical protein
MTKNPQLTPQPTFEYCAFLFLTQWQEEEAELYHAISATPTHKTIRRALSYFQVSRTFKGIDADANAQFVADALISVREDAGLSMGHAKVHALAEIFKRRFKQFNLSAASKLLWLSCREPYVVLDSRAVNALVAMSDGFTGHHYGAYAKVWREQYQKREPLIRAAVAKLPNARMFMREELPPDDILLKMVNESWFMERVFDIYLWIHNGETIG